MTETAWAFRPATEGARRLLYVAAAFNLVAAALLVALLRVAPQALGVPPFAPSQLLFTDLAALLVAGFGVAYALAGRDLPHYWPILMVGSYCKAGVALLVYAHALAGHAGPVVIALATGDAIFAALFQRLLRLHRA